MARSRRIGPALFVLAAALAVWRSGPAGLALLLPVIPAALRPDPDLRPSYALGLPGLPDGPPVKSRVPTRLYSAVGVCGGLLALVVASLGVPPIVLIALAVLLLALFVVAADALVRYLTGNLRLERALRAYVPTIGMAYAGGTGGSWQLRMRSRTCSAPASAASSSTCIRGTPSESLAASHRCDRPSFSSAPAVRRISAGFWCPVFGRCITSRTLERTLAFSSTPGSVTSGSTTVIPTSRRHSIRGTRRMTVWW